MNVKTLRFLVVIANHPFYQKSVHSDLKQNKQMVIALQRGEPVKLGIVNQQGVHEFLVVTICKA